MLGARHYHEKNLISGNFLCKWLATVKWNTIFHRYPMIGVQHHPEKNLFEWATASNYAHSFLGYSYSQYFGDYFVQMARTSCQKFDSEEQLSPYLIYNYPVTYTQGQFKDKRFTQCYLFNQTGGESVRKHRGKL